uniref:Uncharacterized protein n=1 Tax=Cacopsylla melanoneura TaxID=428564 RepID=A0A8D8Z4Q3_9HEMI
MGPQLTRGFPLAMVTISGCGYPSLGCVEPASLIWGEVQELILPASQCLSVHGMYSCMSDSHFLVSLRLSGCQEMFGVWIYSLEAFILLISINLLERDRRFFLF